MKLATHYWFLEILAPLFMESRMGLPILTNDDVIR